MSIHLLIITGGGSDRPTIPPPPLPDPLDDDLVTYIRTAAAPDRVLVVDDDEAIREVLQEVLSAEKHADGSPLYDVAVAHDGDEALACVRAHRPACILLDVMMPGSDGIAAYNYMKATDRYRDIPVFFITASPREPRESPAADEIYVSDPTKAAKLAARKAAKTGTIPPQAAVIAKPFNMADLLAKVRAAVESTKKGPHA